MTSDLVQPVTDLDFEAVVLGAPVPVLVDFTAAWCSPCRALKPILEQVALELGGRCRIVVVDGEESPAIATRFGVRGFPTMIVFNAGKEVARRVGLCSKQQVLAMLQPHQATAMHSTSSRP